MDVNEEMNVEQETHVQEVQDHPIFVCKTVIDSNSQLEGSKAAIGKAAGGSNWIFYGIYLLMGGYLIADSIINSHWQKNALMLVLVAAMTGFTIYSKKTGTKRAMAHWEEAIFKKYGSKALHVTTEFYNHSLVQTIAEDEEQLVCDGYSSVTKIVETENLFLLNHGKNQYYFVAKDGITGGSVDEFRTFIQGKIGG